MGDLGEGGAIQLGTWRALVALGVRHLLFEFGIGLDWIGTRLQRNGMEWTVEWTV